MVRLRALYNATEALLGVRLFKVVRYVTSGGAAALTNLASLFLLVHFGGVYYLYGSVLAFIISVGVSFTMQKFWTFHDMQTHDVHAQFARYTLVITANLLLNTALMYLLVEKAGVWYLLAQFLTSMVVAGTGYFAYPPPGFPGASPPVVCRLVRTYRFEIAIVVLALVVRFACFF